jgi:ABC-2 type transport system permease protein
VQNLAQFLPPYHYSQLALKVIGASRGGSVAYHLGAMALAAALFSAIAYAGYRRDTAQVH